MGRIRENSKRERSLNRYAIQGRSLELPIRRLENRQPQFSGKILSPELWLAKSISHPGRTPVPLGFSIAQNLKKCGNEWITFNAGPGNETNESRARPRAAAYRQGLAASLHRDAD
jgi:hypothetical protein